MMPCTLFRIMLVVLLGPAILLGADMPHAINALGLDLLRQQAAAAHGDANLLLSPYSIQAALAMSYLGATGETRAEMRRALYYPDSEAALIAGLDRLGSQLAALPAQSTALDYPDAVRPPMILHIAQQLFVHADLAIRPEYVEKLRTGLRITPRSLDFAKGANTVADIVNQWVAEHTRGKIRNIISNSQVGELTRAILANAVYFKAQWDTCFYPESTVDADFHVNRHTRRLVPTMSLTRQFGYQSLANGVAVAIPYQGRQLQFLVLLPDAQTSLGQFAAALTPELLQSCTRLPTQQEIELHLPRFSIDPESQQLAAILQTLGMRRAFDLPTGSAEFSGIALPTDKDYLYLGSVIHKTRLAIDEDGTEAAAATVIELATFGVGELTKPVVVRVDRPFLFAIQHVASGACLFLGQLVDPAG